MLAKDVHVELEKFKETRQLKLQGNIERILEDVKERVCLALFVDKDAVSTRFPKYEIDEFPEAKKILEERGFSFGYATYMREDMEETRHSIFWGKNENS